MQQEILVVMVISQITIDTFGHVTAVATATYLTSAVTTIAGTANQVLVNNTSGAATAGAVTLTLPQSIATNSSVTFGSLNTGTIQASAITASSLSLSGDLTVNGTTTTINSSTLTVDDKNIELGSVVQKTGLAATLSTGTNTVTLTSGNTTGLIPGLNSHKDFWIRCIWRWSNSIDN